MRTIEGGLLRLQWFFLFQSDIQPYSKDAFEKGGLSLWQKDR